MPKVRSNGPRPARIMLVGEAPGRDEEIAGRGFVGSSGKLLDAVLAEARINRDECFITNVAKYRPHNNEIQHFFVDGYTKSGKGIGTMRNPGPEIREGLYELSKEIREVQPNVIVAFGNIPLWALQNRPSAKSGITDWRGSELKLARRLPTVEEEIGHSCAVIPTFHPASALREYSNRPLIVHDLQTRVSKYLNNPEVVEPPYRFTVRPSFEQVMERLSMLHSEVLHRPTRIACDIETGRTRTISCIGLAWSALDAICIPLHCIERAHGYWTSEEEVQITFALYQLLSHPNCYIVGQNFLYDAQHFAREMGFLPNVVDDTMWQQSVAYAGMPRGLDFLSSVYCDFNRFWKGEGKDFGNYKTLAEEEGGWIYNCKDAVVTFEVHSALKGTLEKLNLNTQYLFQMEQYHHYLRLMLRGIKVDTEARKPLQKQLMEDALTRQSEINYIVGHELNPRSPKQMRSFFYGDLQMPVQFSLGKKNADGTKKETLDSEALVKLSRQEPLLRPLLQRIAELRSMGVFSSMLNAALSQDGRMRCYYGMAESYRRTSSEDAFGSGANLQNIPRGSEDAIEADELSQYHFPNIRKTYVPDRGYTIGEVDQAGADAQVLAYDADDPILKQIFRENRKLHVENGRMMYGAHMMGSDGKREPYYTRVKTGCHATNYGAKAPKLSAALSITIHEADRFQRRWFEMHPWILEWQKVTLAKLQTAHQVVNRFGFRRQYFDRIESILPEALAWVPQSTVAINTDIAFANTEKAILLDSTIADRASLPGRAFVQRELARLGFEILLQVHDSLVFQFPTANQAAILPLLRRALTITVPYDDPLQIPWGLKLSRHDWGSAEEDKTWWERYKPEKELVMAA